MKFRLVTIALLIILCSACLPQSQKPQRLSPEEMAKLDQRLGELGPPASLQVEQMEMLTPDVVRSLSDENPLNASAVYGDEWLKVRGRLDYGPVETTSLQGIHTYVLTLESKGKTLPCAFIGEAKAEELKLLKKGQMLTVVGRYAHTNTTPGLNLCRIIQAK